MSNALRILLALVVGLALGTIGAAVAPDAAQRGADIADPVGALWLNGLRMTIVPLVVALLITGIVQSAQAARAGRMAARTVFAIVALMTLSALVGAMLTPLFLSLVPMPAESAAALKAALTTAPAVAAVPPFGDFLRALVPTNVIAAAAADQILPLILFTTVFAFAVTRLPEGQRVTMNVRP